MKIEMHAHTSEVSQCAHVPAAEMVRIYKQLGYDAVVLTNHLAPYMPIPDWKGRVDFFLDGYRLAKLEGEKQGLPVFFGVEINFTENHNDYLIYGLTEEFMKTMPDVLDWGLERFYPWAKQQGLLTFQAHPYRFYIVPINPAFLDGVEVHNGTPRHQSHNEKAMQLAKEHHLLEVSGSDFHEYGDEGLGGIITSVDVKNVGDLTDVLKKREYKLIL